MRFVLGLAIFMSLANTDTLEWMRIAPIEQRRCIGRNKLVSAGYKRARMRTPPRL